MKVNLLSNSLYTGEEGVDMFDILFIEKSVSISEADRYVQFGDWELMSFDKVIVDVGQVYPTIN